MTDLLASRIAELGVAILDGGFATQLEAAGHDLRGPLWSARILLEDPDAVRTVHRNYVDAGADVITAATYQATFGGLAGRGLDHDQAEALMRDAVRLAREAARTTACPPLVAGSLGPYGAYLADGSEYRGDYGLSVADLADFHRPRLRVLATEADVVAFETIPCLSEARALAEALCDVARARAWVSFSCRDERHVWHGETIEDCIAAVATLPQVVAVGVNCIAPHHALELVKRTAAMTDKSILVYPNSGERYDKAHSGGWTGPPTGIERFVELAETWVDAGARIIGGCCRTTPAHVRALVEWRTRAQGSGPRPGFERRD